MDKNTALRELDRFRNLAKRQQKENEELHRELHFAWNEKKGCEAFLAAILKQCGEITISKEAVGEALKNKLRVVVKVDEITATYALKVVNTDGEEDSD